MQTRRGHLIVVLATLVGFGAGTAFSNRAFSSTEGSHQGFSNRDFRGSYGFLEVGTVLGQPFYQIARVSSDGAGSVLVESVGTSAESGGELATAECDSSVQENGMGQMDCADEAGNEFRVDFILVDGGRQLQWVSSAPGAQIYGTARRQ